MTRFLFDTATSFDGYLADTEHSLDWLFAVPGGAEPDPSLLPSTATTMVEGSTTYEWVLAESDMLAHPERWAEFHEGKTVFVFTTRDLPVPEGADVRFVRGLVADALPAIREAAGDGDVWILGGGDLAGQFLEAGALDEIALSVAPVALGRGAPLFPRRVESDRLTLRSARRAGQFARLVFAVDAPAPSPEDASLDAAEEALLRRAVALSHEARAAGNHPFGALLADADGRIVLEAQNTVTTERDITGHAETNLIREAWKVFTPEQLAGFTLFTSCEPCAMCSGAMYWAGIARMVFGLSEEGLLELTGAHPENPTLSLASRIVLGAGTHDVEISGPHLVEEAAAAHQGFWR